VADQHRSAVRSLDCAQAKLTEYENEGGAHSTRKEYNLKRAELGLTRLRTSKKETLLRARDLSAQLIQECIKFTNFAVRQTKQAPVRLGAALTRDGALELAVLMKAIEALQKA
jgi:hypothetical protein